MCLIKLYYVIAGLARVARQCAISSSTKVSSHKSAEHAGHSTACSNAERLALCRTFAGWLPSQNKNKNIISFYDKLFALFIYMYNKNLLQLSKCH